MLDDVIKRQKLEAEIKEGEEAVAKFSKDDSTSKSDEDEKEVVGTEETNVVDLTPSLRGTQTLSLTDNGEWRSEGVSDSVPLHGGEENPPPPPPPSRNFHDRFLLGKSSNSAAIKEIQKLKWTKDHGPGSQMADIPFPDLTEACKMLLLLMVEKDIGEENGQNEPENDDDSRLSLRKRVARWGYYHGKRSYQEFFIKYS